MGLCSFVGGIATMIIQKVAGNLFAFAEKAGASGFMIFNMGDELGYSFGPLSV